MFNKLKLLGLSIGLAMAWMLFSNTSIAAADNNPTYKPLVKGAPNTRVGGGSRGMRGHRGLGENTVVLNVLAPNHTGHTIHSQPVLYWSISEVLDKPLKLTMVYTDFTLGIEPVIETEIKAPQTKGIQRLDLAEVDWKTPEKELKPEIEYQWSISIVMDASQSTNDIVSSGTIKRVSPQVAKQITAKVVSSTEEQAQAFSYAEQGIWYDAIDTLSKLIMKQPSDQKLRSYRATLLEQVGLGNLAKQDLTS